MASSDDAPSAALAGRGPLAAWFADADVAPLATAGFSGAPLFRVQPAGGPPCVLKAFAAGTTRARAEWIHSLVAHLRGRHWSEVPEVLPSRSGDTLVTDARGTHWELQRFVAGTALDAPTPAQAATALDAIARCHRAAESLPAAAPSRGPSPGVARRIEQARALAARPWRVRRSAAAPRHPRDARLAALWDEAVDVIETGAGARAVAAVAGAEIAPVICQAVIRDVWAAHVLFAAGAPERVAGIVDLHAAAVDSPATDLARLLGSWAAPPARAGQTLADRWPEPFAAYESVRPLAPGERRLVTFLHAAGVICALDNWFRWTLEEAIAFHDTAAVRVRVEKLLAELPAAVKWLAEPGVCRV